jgi:hypothetical protein
MRSTKRLIIVGLLSVGLGCTSIASASTAANMNTLASTLRVYLRAHEPTGTLITQPVCTTHHSGKATCVIDLANHGIAILTASLTFRDGKWWPTKLVALTDTQKITYTYSTTEKLVATKTQAIKPVTSSGCASDGPTAGFATVNGKLWPCTAPAGTD